MKGTPTEKALVTGALKEEALKIVYAHRHKATCVNGFSTALKRLRFGQMRINGLAGMLHKIGYCLEIKIVKK